MLTLVVFGAAGLLLCVGTQMLIPWSSEVTGIEPILIWFIVGGLGIFAPLLVFAYLLLRREGSFRAILSVHSASWFPPNESWGLALGNRSACGHWGAECGHPIHSQCPARRYADAPQVYGVRCAFTGTVLDSGGVASLLDSQYHERGNSLAWSRAAKARGRAWFPKHGWPTHSAGLCFISRLAAELLFFSCPF